MIPLLTPVIFRETVPLTQMYLITSSFSDRKRFLQIQIFPPIRIRVQIFFRIRIQGKTHFLRVNNKKKLGGICFCLPVSEFCIFCGFWILLAKNAFKNFSMYVVCIFNQDLESGSWIHIALDAGFSSHAGSKHWGYPTNFFSFFTEGCPNYVLISYKCLLLLSRSTQVDSLSIKLSGRGGIDKKSVFIFKGTNDR